MKYIIMLALVCVIFSGCNKLSDYFGHGGGQSSSCKITRITYKDSVYDYSTDITYNSAGYPVAVDYVLDDIYTSVPLSYTFNYSYDASNRLVSQNSEWVYSEPTVFYAYEGNSKSPARDTIPGLFGDVYVEDLSYDNSGRIIKVVKRMIQTPDSSIVFPDETHAYYYDDRGNRQEDPSNPDYPGLIQYSDKPSLYSLHPVWKLMHKDYSKNSVFYGETFNDKELPLTIKRDTVPYFQHFLNLLYGSAISYDCQ